MSRAVETRKVDSKGKVLSPGDYFIGQPDKRTGIRQMHVFLPGHTTAVQLAVVAGPSKLASVMAWNGDEDRPTLAPHISAATTESDRWRGHLRNGLLTAMT